MRSTASPQRSSSTITLWRWWVSDNQSRSQAFGAGSNSGALPSFCDLWVRLCCASLSLRCSQQLWMRCSSRQKISPIATARPPCCWTACPRSCRTPQMWRMWSNVRKIPEVNTPAMFNELITNNLSFFFFQTRLAWTAGFQPSATALSRSMSSNTQTHAQGASSPAPCCSSSPSSERASSVTYRLLVLLAVSRPELWQATDVQFILPKKTPDPEERKT